MVEFFPEWKLNVEAESDEGDTTFADAQIDLDLHPVQLSLSSLSEQARAIAQQLMEITPFRRGDGYHSSAKIESNSFTVDYILEYAHDCYSGSFQQDVTIRSNEGQSPTVSFRIDLDHHNPRYPFFDLSIGEKTIPSIGDGDLASEVIEAIDEISGVLTALDRDLRDGSRVSDLVLYALSEMGNLADVFYGPKKDLGDYTR